MARHTTATDGSDQSTAEAAKTIRAPLSNMPVRRQPRRRLRLAMAATAVAVFSSAAATEALSTAAAPIGWQTRAATPLPPPSAPTTPQPTESLDAWLRAGEFEDDDDETDDALIENSVPGYFRLLDATGSEVLEAGLQSQIDQARHDPDAFLRQKDASLMEKVAMSSVVEQLPRRAVEALAQAPVAQPTTTTSVVAPRKRRTPQKRAPRVTVEEEQALGRTIQKGAALQRLRQELFDQLGRDPTKQEWADAAGMTPRDVRRRISDYRSAKQALVEANLGLVHAVVNRRYKATAQRTGVSREDLVQEGSLGLLRAAELFDPTRGVRFSTYAVLWIKAMLQRSHFTELVRLPDREKTIRNKITTAERELRQVLVGRPATEEEIAKAAGLKTEQVAATRHKMAQAQRVLSLDQRPMRHSRSGGLEDSTESAYEGDPNLRANEDLVEHTRLQADLLGAMAKALDDREARLIRLRYGLTDGRARSLPQCAEAMGISYTLTQRLHERCLKKLRTVAEAGAMEEYLLTIA